MKVIMEVLINEDDIESILLWSKAAVQDDYEYSRLKGRGRKKSWSMYVIDCG